MPNKTLQMKSLFLASIVLLVSMVLTACGGGSAQTTPTSAITVITAAPGVAVLNIATNAKLGKILVTGTGVTLYQFKLDTPGVTVCLSTCSATWPPLISKDAPVLASPDIKGKVGIMTRPDGTQQVTYNDLPLYYFTLDTRPGDTSGNGYGGNWAVVVP